MADVDRATRDRAIVARVRWSAEDGAYVATRDDEPTLSWLAATPAAALNGLLALGDADD
jgi:hypothetical protein